VAVSLSGAPGIRPLAGRRRTAATGPAGTRADAVAAARSHIGPEVRSRPA